MYHFEAFTIGLQPHVAKFDEGDDVAMQKLGKTLTDIKMDTEFIKITTGGGKNSPGPLQERIAFVEKRVGEVA